MPISKLPLPQMGKDDKETIENLYNAYFMLRKELEFLESHLDSENITSITTEHTRVMSERGETEIKGPLIIMKDKQGTPVLRLQMGYNPETEKFTFNMFDSAGNNTVTLSDTGQLVLSGKPLFSMYDNSGTLRLQMGFDTTINKFVFNMYDANGNLTLSENDSGEAVFAGNIQTSKDARVGKNLYLGSQGDNTPKTMYFNEFTYIKGSTGIAGTDIEIGCHEIYFTGIFDGSISFIGNTNFSNSSVGGLENSGYYKLDYIQNWVTQNFVHK